MVVARRVRRHEKQNAERSRPEKAVGLVENKFIIDPSLLDFDNPIADIDAIREMNPQRFEMEQLTSILYEDVERNILRCAEKCHRRRVLDSGPHARYATDARHRHA